jgi:hypothetical protein
MTVRCVQCGQENNPQYRFCGMCGAPLGPAPGAVAGDVGRERVRIPVSGPSFLGLGDEHSRDLDYLLEDDPPRGHGRLYVALILLVLSGGLLAWHWERDGYPWAAYLQKSAVANSAPASSPPAPAPDTTAAAAPAVPEPTANPAPPEAQPAAGEASQPPAGEPSAASTGGNLVAAAKPADQTPTPGDTSDATEGASKAPNSASIPTEAAEPGPKEARAATAAATPKAVTPKPPAVPSTTFEDRLVAEGERYLYGRGVREDCTRAQRNLQIAARQSNPKAQTMLGAMYATGHCASRDLPTAYRWFAQALHGDPSNSRVQRDLEVLWKQMTPEERQLAMKSQ